MPVTSAKQLETVGNQALIDLSNALVTPLNPQNHIFWKSVSEGSRALWSKELCKFQQNFTFQCHVTTLNTIISMWKNTVSGGYYARKASNFSKKNIVFPRVYSHLNSRILCWKVTCTLSFRKNENSKNGKGWGGAHLFLPVCRVRPLETFSECAKRARNVPHAK